MAPLEIQVIIKQTDLEEREKEWKNREKILVDLERREKLVSEREGDLLHKEEHLKKYLDSFGIP